MGFELSPTEMADPPAKLPDWARCITVPLGVPWVSDDTQVGNDSDTLKQNTTESEFVELKTIHSTYREQTKLVCCGPILDFSRKKLPGWLNLEDTFELQRQTAANLARSFARNFHQSIQLAYVAAGLNGIETRTLSYPNQLQITVDMLEGIENVRSDIPTMVSFDQPWGERLAWRVGGTHPSNIADSLLRNGLQISCFGLEVNLGYWPHGSLARGMLQWVELIDYWSQFGLPLFVILSAPVGSAAEIQGTRGLRKRNTQQQLTEYISNLIPVLLSKPIVNGIAWRQWNDHSNMRFPLSGLRTADGEPKETMDLMHKMGQRAYPG